MFSDFSTLRPVFKKVHFQARRFQDLCAPSAKTMQYVFTKERFRVDGPLVCKEVVETVWKRRLIAVNPLPGLAIRQGLDSLSHPPGVSCVTEVSLDFLCIGAFRSVDFLLPVQTWLS